MKFIETKIPGLTLIEIEPLLDERGMFARMWCEKEMQKHGLVSQLRQCSISYSPETGTLRGMHFQLPPYMETKIVRCTRGSIFDVALDLRESSPTYKQWLGFELSAENHRMLYIPEGMAHGLITLEPNTEVFYQISQTYVPESASGVRWNDPAFAIQWPMEPTVISLRDSQYPNFAFS